MSDSGGRRLVAFQIYALITSILMVHSAVNSWRINTRDNPGHLQGGIRMLLFSRVSKGLLLGEVGEKRKRQTFLWESSHTFGQAVWVEQAKIWYFYFQPLTPHIWKPNFSQTEGSFLFYFKNFGKKIKHLVSILLAKVTTIYALVGNYKICNIWLGNQCLKTSAILVHCYF